MRLSSDEWALQIAEVTALRGTCARRQVGCVLTNERGIVLATGFNGVPRGVRHCNEIVQEPVYGEERTQQAWRDDPDRKGKRRLETWTTRSVLGYRDTAPFECTAANAPSGTDLDACMATHAEVNAIAQCADVDRIHTCYTTTEPCVSCTKMLMNTGCIRVVYRTPYPHNSAALWLSRAISTGVSEYRWIHLPRERSDVVGNNA